MKGRNIRSWAIALALAAALVPFSQMFGAQNQGQRQRPPNAQQQPPNSQQAASTQKPRTYIGKIVKTQGGKFALLTNPQKGKGFFLDDQKDAKKFDQKDVKVIATLDPQTSTLHVIEIKLAS